jgi:DNA-directed RNA polymerase specialized sigma24 family protein
MQYLPETPFLLTQWGRWARQKTGLRLGHSQPAAWAIHRKSSPSPMIEDATALWVDQCVAQVTPERVRDAVVMRFVLGASQSRIGRELGCHRKTVASMVDAGMHQVAEMLEG